MKIIKTTIFFLFAAVFVLTSSDILAIAGKRIKDQQERAVIDSDISPSQWIKKNLKQPLMAHQIEPFDAIQHGNVVVAAGNAVGKTFAAAGVALWFLDTRPESIVVTTAPTDLQVNKLLWGEIRKAFRSASRRLQGRLLDQEIKIADKHYAVGFTSSKHEAASRFQGFHAADVLVIVDEASGVAPEVFEAIDAIASGGRVRIMIIGNPLVAAGGFWKVYNDSDYQHFAISIFESPNFTSQGITAEDIRSGTWQAKDDPARHSPGLCTPDWAAKKAWGKYGEPSSFCQARAFARFPTDAEDGLIPLSDILACQALEEYSTAGDKVIMVDVARSEDGDETVIYLRLGQLIEEKWIGRTRDTTEIVSRIRVLADEHKDAKIKIDAVGLGGPMCDQLRKLGYDVIDIVAGEAADDPKRFKNLRAEMFWLLREEIVAHNRKLPDDEVLANQLASIRYYVPADKQIVLESKEQIKKRLGGNSPDRADALAIGEARASLESYIDVLKRSMA